MSSDLLERPGSLVHRYYDPVTSQFLGVDPLVDETGTPYAFTGGDPVNWTDPTGEAFWDSFGAVVSSVLATWNAICGLPGHPDTATAEDWAKNRVEMREPTAPPEPPPDAYPPGTTFGWAPEDAPNASPGSSLGNAAVGPQPSSSTTSTLDSLGQLERDMQQEGMGRAFGESLELDTSPEGDF